MYGLNLYLFILNNPGTHATPGGGGNAPTRLLPATNKLQRRRRRFDVRMRILVLYRLHFKDNILLNMGYNASVGWVVPTLLDVDDPIRVYGRL